LQCSAKRRDNFTGSSFRTTILPQTDKLKIMLKKFKEFHLKFLSEYE
jgi:hypothetical protein